MSPAFVLLLVVWIRPFCVHCQARFFSNRHCKYYIHYDTRTSFAGASDHCITLGGSLAMVKNQTVHSFIVASAAQIYDINTDIYLWIGGSINHTEWQWVDGTRIPRKGDRFEKWHRGKPSGNEEMCMQMSSYWMKREHGSWAELEWTDKACDDNVGYVCEVSIGDPCSSITCANGDCVKTGCQYRCQCSPGFRGEMCEDELIEITANVTLITVEIGDNATITLNIHSSDGPVTVTAYSSTEVVEKRSDLTNIVTFTIGPMLQASEGTNFTFRASPQSNGYFRETKVKVRVLGGATIDQVEPEYLMIPTSDTISCSASGIPAPTIRWYKGGVPVSEVVNNGVYQTLGEKAVILHVAGEGKGEDIGNYICKANNTIEQDIITDSKTVFLGSSIRLTRPDTQVKNVTIRSRLSFNCTFEGYPKPFVQWKWKSVSSSYDITGETGYIFTISSTNSLPANGIDRVTSVLNVQLSESLGAGNISCTANNAFEQHQGAVFSMNNHLRHHRDSYFVFYGNDDVKNQPEAKLYCSTIGAALAKIPDNDTQEFVYQHAKSVLNIGDYYIGAEANESSGYRIWRWQDGTFMYNQSKYESFTSGLQRTLDGHYIRWGNGHPESNNASCSVIRASASGEWQSQTCSKSGGFVCEIPVHGKPIIQEVEVEHCTTNMTVTWKPSPAAIMIQHRVNAFPLNYENGTIWSSSIILPDNEHPIVTRISGLEYATAYNIKVSACANECEDVLFAEDRINTPSLSTGVVTNAIVTQQPNDSCSLSWSFSDPFIGFQVTAESSLVYPVPGKNEFKNNVWTEDQSFGLSFPGSPNRNYTFFVQARTTCGGFGQTVKATGPCVTKRGPPATVPKPMLPSGNNGSRFQVTIQFPDESHGPISCIFLTAVLDEASVKTEYSADDLLLAANNAEMASVVPNSEYISNAIPRSQINESLSVMIGDDTTSSCNVGEVANVQRKKRSLEPGATLNGKSLPLKSGGSYKFYLVTTTPGDDDIYVKRSDPTFYRLSEVNYTDGNNAWIAGIVVTIIVLSCLAIAMIYFVKRKRDGEIVARDIQMDSVEEPREPVYANLAMDGNESKSETDIPMQDILAVYKSQRANDNVKFLEEFEALKMAAKAVAASTEIASSVSLKKKNRYKNILPFDSSRVVLEGKGEESYINACYIDGYNQPQKFIAAQGPLPCTVIDFWRMIAEEKCRVIVMLTKCIEKHRVKCEKYWPDQGELLQFGNISLKGKEEKSYGSYFVRKISLTINGKEQNITQFHFVKWPDHGVPVTTSAFFRFHKTVMKCQRIGNTSQPIVVHCSAGAGRTGTFIGYDILLEESQSLNRIDVYSCVLNMRRQRVDMVQNCDQYIFIHKLLAENHLFGSTESDSKDLAKLLQSESVAEELRKEFDNLETIGPMDQAKHGNQLKVGKMNRNKEVVPYEHNHVVLTRKPEETTTPYMNGSHMEVFSDATPIIAAQGPMERTVEYFWRAILDNNINTIVMLTNCFEGNKEQCFKYWPKNAGETFETGGICIEMTSEMEEGDIVQRKFTLSSGDDPTIVTQLHFTGWESTSCPKDAFNLLQLVQRMQAIVRSTANGAALVHCSDGAGRTGAFCAIVNLIDRLKCDGKVDVFRTVKDLRDARPGMVKTLDQYRFCYEALLKYYIEFNLYSTIEMAADEKFVSEERA